MKLLDDLEHSYDFLVKNMKERYRTIHEDLIAKLRNL